MNREPITVPPETYEAYFAVHDVICDRLDRYGMFLEDGDQWADLYLKDMYGRTLLICAARDIKLEEELDYLETDTMLYEDASCVSVLAGHEVLLFDDHTRTISRYYFGSADVLKCCVKFDFRQVGSLPIEKYLNDTQKSERAQTKAQMFAELALLLGKTDLPLTIPEAQGLAVALRFAVPVVGIPGMQAKSEAFINNEAARNLYDAVGWVLQSCPQVRTRLEHFLTGYNIVSRLELVFNECVGIILEKAATPCYAPQSERAAYDTTISIMPLLRRNGRLLRFYVANDGRLDVERFGQYIGEEFDTEKDAANILDLIASLIAATPGKYNLKRRCSRIVSRYAAKTALQTFNND